MKKIMWMLRDADGVPGGVVDPAAPVVPVVPAALNTDDPTPVVDPAAVEPEPATVPIAAIKDERKKRQDAEALAQKQREELAYLQGQLAAKTTPTTQAVAPQTPQSPVAPVRPIKPRIEDFGDDWQAADRAQAQWEVADNQWQNDNVQFIIAKTEFELTQKFEQRMAQGRQQQTQEQVVSAFQTKLNKEAELDPELLTIASSFHLPGPNYMPITGPMQEAIMESDVGPQLLRYFANNKAQVMRLSVMTPASAVREIGKIEAALTTQIQQSTVTHVTAAPDPIKTVGTGGTQEVDEDKIPMADYMARERAKVAARIRR